MKTEIFQILITLQGSEPKIWRRVLIPSNLLLADLHKIIQTTMGWQNSHLHQFIKDRQYYSVDYGDDFYEEMNSIDYVKKKIRVSDLLTRVKSKMIYEYDFGDSWEHEILLEKKIPAENQIFTPVCVDGEMNCPPEDCGGVWGYADMLEVLKQPKHKDYKDYKEWLGDDFDPKHFDLDEVNQQLKEKDYGCFTW